MRQEPSTSRGDLVARLPLRVFSGHRSTSEQCLLYLCAAAPAAWRYSPRSAAPFITDLVHDDMIANPESPRGPFHNSHCILMHINFCPDSWSNALHKLPRMTACRRMQELQTQSLGPFRRLRVHLIRALTSSLCSLSCADKASTGNTRWPSQAVH
jgi:hypothetical protein